MVSVISSPAMPLFVHVGLHKTATTYLQVDVFPHLSGVNYINGNDSALLSWKRRMYMQDPLIFDVEQARNTILSHMEGDNNLLSTEALSGSPMGQYLGRDLILQKLKAMFPEARIILGIRAQPDIIWSLYKNYVRKGGTCRLDQMVDPYGAVVGRDFIDLDTYKYGPYLDRISSLFGRENLHIVVFEQLAMDRDGLLRGLSDFLGAEIEGATATDKRAVGIGDRAVPVIRALNNVFMARGRETPRRLAAIRRMSKLLDRAVGLLPPREAATGDKAVLHPLPDYYRADNSDIDTRYGLGLAGQPRMRQKYGL